jgi:excisionase family DNA binding protein
VEAVSDYYSARQIAGRLGVPIRTVYQWIDDGILPSLRLRRRLLVPVTDFEELLRCATVRGARNAPPTPQK